MTYIEKLLKRLFPNKLITHRLSELNNNLSKQDVENIYICISAEKENGSRIFCYVTFDELIILYQCCPLTERFLYELINETKQVKSYIDFEYYINNNNDITNPYIGPNTCLKILYSLFKEQNDTNNETDNFIHLALKQFLVLDA